MTTVNPRLIYATDLQSYFVDKDTGLPLAEGVVTFYRNSSRTILKNVYQLTGTPGNPIYTALPNPMTLSGVGTPQDAMGNDVLILYYPYVGAPDDEDAEDAAVDLYYITVYAKTIAPATEGVRQFTREFFPNLEDGSVSTVNDQFNFVPNGQFLVHNNIPATSTNDFIAGKISSDVEVDGVTKIAPGGWTFERSPSATTVDIVTFPKFDGWVANPTSSPRFACNVECRQTGTNSIKFVGIKWLDVNKFTSEDGSIKYNFYIEGKVESGSLSVQLYLKKFFGSNGSVLAAIPQGDPLILTTTYQKFNTEIDFSDNQAYEIGDGEDNTTYVQIYASLPATATCNVTFDNASLTASNSILSQFPEQTEADCLTRTVTGWMPIPDPDGMDLYLPLINTKEGMIWDDSSIGKPYLSFSEELEFNEIALNGEKLETDSYSDLGIPYSRLFDKYNNTTLNIPIGGTGADYFTSAYGTYFGYASNTFRLINNTLGAVFACAAGTTTFTFSSVHVGSTTYDVKSFLVGEDTFYIVNNAYGICDTLTGSGQNIGIEPGNSGFTVANISFGSTITSQISSCKTIAASGIAASDYFRFENPTTTYFVWFAINGGGSAPAPGGTGIRIDLLSTDTAAMVAQKIQEGLNAWNTTLVNCVAASAITGGQYWTANSTGDGFYIWYKKDGVGTEPTVPGRIGIEVDILSADTNAQVALKTIQAMNRKYFALPDLRGLFPRGWDDGANVDSTAAERYSLIPGYQGDMLVTYQLDTNRNHSHEMASNEAGGSGTPLSAGLGTGDQTSPDGSYESQPRNFNARWITKY